MRQSPVYPSRPFVPNKSIGYDFLRASRGEARCVLPISRVSILSVRA